MADNALTRKEAGVGRVTREFIDEKRFHLTTLKFMPLDERMKDKVMTEIALCDLALRALQHAPARVAEGVIVPEGESLWLIEQTSTVDGKRRFWNGAGYGWDALKAARYPSRQAAEEVARDSPNCEVGTVHGHPEVCGHMFQCGISPESPAKEQPREQNAAPQAGPPVITSSSQEDREAGPAAAAPDAAAIVREFNAMCDAFAAEDEGLSLTPDVWNRLRGDLRRAAILIEKLGQGWIPVDSAPRGADYVSEGMLTVYKWMKG